MIVHLSALTPGGHFGATSGVDAIPSSTTFAAATVGESPPKRPTAAAATACRERFMLCIEHDSPAEVAATPVRDPGKETEQASQKASGRPIRAPAQSSPSDVRRRY